MVRFEIYRIFMKKEEEERREGQKEKMKNEDGQKCSDKLRAFLGMKKSQTPRKSLQETTASPKNDVISIKVKSATSNIERLLEDPGESCNKLQSRKHLKKMRSPFWRKIQNLFRTQKQKKEEPEIKQPEKSAVLNVQEDKEPTDEHTYRLTQGAKNEICIKTLCMTQCKKRFRSEEDIGFLSEPFHKKCRSGKIHKTTVEKVEDKDLFEKSTTAIPEPEIVIREDGDKLGPRQSFITCMSDPVEMKAENFNFHSVLGEGGFAKVILATDHVRGKEVAIKISKKPLFRCKHLMVEQRVLQLSHECPFLIHGYGAFQTHKYVCYVMELARRGTLFDLFCEIASLKTEVTMHITAELICGIQFLHGKGIIHRDLKLENVLFLSDGHVKIADFGIAVENVFGREKKYGRIGTLGYMAPEVLRGRPYNEGADWFSLGVMVYELLTLCSPFEGNAMKTIISTLNTEPCYKALDQVKADFLKGLLCKDPSQRLGVHGDIRGHPFFERIQWRELEAGHVPLPLALQKLPRDTINNHLHERIDVALGTAQQKCLFKRKDLRFKEFGFVSPAWAADYYIPSLVEE